MQPNAFLASHLNTLIGAVVQTSNIFAFVAPNLMPLWLTFQKYLSTCLFGLKPYPNAGIAITAGSVAAWFADPKHAEVD